MTATLALRELLEELIHLGGTFILRNDHGSMEFRGHDLSLHPYEEWLTIYHATPKNPESQSHLHVRWATIQAAAVQQEDGQTPLLAFYGDGARQGESWLVWYFPSFYDWSKGKRDIPANLARYEAFVAAHGMVMQFR